MNFQESKSVLFFSLFLSLFTAFIDSLLTIAHKPADLNSAGLVFIPIVITAIFLNLFFLPGVVLLRTFSAKYKWPSNSEQIVGFLFLVAEIPLLYGLRITEINLHTWSYLRNNFLIFLGLSLILLRIFTSSWMVTRSGHLHKIWNPFKKAALPVLFTAVILLWMLEYPVTRTPGIIKAAIIFMGLLLISLCIFPRTRLSKVPRDGWISLILMLILSTGFPLAQRDLIKTSKPHRDVSLTPPDFSVFLITIDALRPDYLSCYNPETAVKTPAIDSLAGGGILFENAFTPATWTKPSIASLMTGLPPLIHQANTHQSGLPDEWLTLAEALTSVGMRTAGIGYNYLVSEKFNYDRGFQYYHFFPKNTPDTGFGLGLKITYLWFAPLILRGKPDTEDLIDLTISYCRSNADCPIFLWLHIFDPHFPYHLSGHALPKMIAGDPVRAAEISQKIRTIETLTDPAEREWVRQCYQAEIQAVDNQLNRLFSYLKRSGRYDRSFIVLSSDHGEELWEHGGYGHGKTLFNETLKVPLIFKLPKPVTEIRRRRIPESVSMLSLMPTLLEFCGYPDTLDSYSHSLRSHWEKTGPVFGPPIYCASRFLKTDLECIVTDSLKYIRDINQPDNDLVFNWFTNPEETQSLRTTYPELSQRLKATLDSSKKQLLRLHPQQTSHSMLIQHTPADLERLRSLGYIK
jgi:arylsulfatase A-like enzyme